MHIGLNAGSHLLQRGGGFKAVYWHWRALRELGHDITIFVRSGIHPALMPLFHGTPFRAYRPGCEEGFDSYGSIDHFNSCLPLAKDNWCHVMFPVIPPPADGIRITTNSAYTASHVKDRWNRDASVMYIPIENHYRVGNKEKIIMHVSRFAEPNEFADKAHMQFIQVMRMFRNDLPGWKLMLVGAVENGQHGYVDALMKMASGYPVDFLFDPNDEEITDLYSRASIYWHATGISLPMIPSAQEHMGIAPLEAQASGCVPIAYRSGGMPEVVRENQTGLLFDDVRQLGQYTVDLANQLHTWAAFQQYGLMWAKSWQDWPSFVGRVKNFLDGEPIAPLPNYIPDLPFRQQDVTAVIPTYNNVEVLTRCLDSLKKTAPKMRILVMNNGEPLPAIDGVCIHDVGYNSGFAGAYKLSETMIDTPLVLLLNDDTEAFNPNWLAMMVLPLADPQVGIVGAKLLFSNGRLQHAGGAIDWSRSDVGFHLHYGEPDSLDASTTREVPFVTGACMMMRRELFKMPEELIGGLCYEEAYISALAREQGYKTVYQPAACLIHHEGVTRKRTPEDEAKVERNKALFRARWMK